MNAHTYYMEEKETKVKAIKFELVRAEGLIAECGPAAPVATWKAADDILRHWAKTAPDEGQGYDKCDFTVTYADGETYTGRYDLKRHDMGLTNLLARHINGFVRFYAGLEKPDYMSEKAYADRIATLGEETKKYADFVEKYEIGDTESISAAVLTVTHDPKPEHKPRYMKTDKNSLPKSKPVCVVVGNRWEKDGYNVEIWKNQAIRLYGSYSNHVGGPVQYDITFKIGDIAEYDSYNLSYTGKIVAIGEKTVTIEHHGEKSRLNLGKFAWRNWDFDLEETSKNNAEEMMYI